MRADHQKPDLAQEPSRFGGVLRANALGRPRSARRCEALVAVMSGKGWAGSGGRRGADCSDGGPALRRARRARHSDSRRPFATQTSRPDSSALVGARRAIPRGSLVAKPPKKRGYTGGQTPSRHLSEQAARDRALREDRGSRDAARAHVHHSTMLREKPRPLRCRRESSVSLRATERCAR